MSDIKWFINNGDYFYFKYAPAHLSGVSLDKSEISLNTIGQTEQLTATTIPANPVETVSLNWSSSDTSIATVAPYVPRLPSEYQEVEYIESSGTQYIDTGWTPNSNYARVVTNMTFLGGVNSTTAVFFGMTSGSTGYSLHKNPNWQINAGSSGNVNIATYSDGNLNVDFTLNNNSYTVKLGGSTYTGSYGGSIVQNTMSMNIFNYHESGSNTWWAYAKLYSFKIYSAADTLVRDFVPCYRKVDNVIGLYDLVNDTFYTNAGTGTFTKGSDINPDAIVTCVTPGECTITVTTTPGSYTASCSVISGWHPGANTLAYFPLVNDTQDNVGSATIIGSGTLTKASVGYNVSCTNNSISTTVAGGKFWSGRVKFNSKNDYYIGFMNNGAGLYFNHYESRLKDKFYVFTSSSYAASTSNSLGLTTGTWYYICYGNYDTAWKFYINGTETFTTSSTNYFGNDSINIYNSGDTNRTDNADISELIVEDTAWTATQITEYYNQTKGNYGL